MDAETNFAPASLPESTYDAYIAGRIAQLPENFSPQEICALLESVGEDFVCAAADVKMAQIKLKQGKSDYLRYRIEQKDSLTKAEKLADSDPRLQELQLDLVEAQVRQHKAEVNWDVVRVYARLIQTAEANKRDQIGINSIG